MASVRIPQFRHPFAYDEVPIPDTLVAQVFEYLFSTTRWKDDPDQLKRRVVIWRAELRESRKHPPAREASPTPAQDPPAPPASLTAAEVAGRLCEIEEEWIQKACTMRVVDRAGYDRIAAEVGKSKKTVRRWVPPTLSALGIENPEAVGTVRSDGTVAT